VARPKRDLKNISVQLEPDIAEHLTAKAKVDGVSRNTAAVAAIVRSLDAPPISEDMLPLGEDEERLELVLPRAVGDKLRTYAQENNISFGAAVQRGIAEEVGMSDPRFARLRMPVKLWNMIGEVAQNRAGFVVNAIETALKPPEKEAVTARSTFAVPGPARRIIG